MTNLDGILIECPHCKMQGHGEILARITPDMNVTIIRRHKGFTTTIESKEYILKCVCGKSVFKRDNDGTAYL